MKKRALFFLLVIVLPIAIALAIARFALPAMVQAPDRNSTAILELPDSSPRTVPEKLEEAKQMAVERLMHLQKLSQKEWDAERKKILYKHPPEEIGAAITRTQLRIADLNQMMQEQWVKERERIMRTEQERLSKASKK